LSVGQWAGNFLAAESWRHHLAGGEPTYLMGNTWTLCYEEQFYFVTGVMLAFAARRFFAAAAWLTVAVLAARHFCQFAGISQDGFFWDGHWVMFAAGILVYYALNYRKPRRRGWAYAVLVAGMLYGAADRLLAVTPFQKHLGEYVFVACTYAVALMFLKPWDQAISTRRSLAPLRWCGQRSYSIYLTHYLIVVVASCWLALGGLRSEWLVATVVVPTCLLISLPAAMLFHIAVERPCMNQG
jgi:peptidoglycan/LPS O-acetylase OafA/YrhL